MELNPNVVFLYNLLGLTLTAQNKNDEAVECYNKGIKIDPNYAMIYKLTLIRLSINHKCVFKTKQFYRPMPELIFL